MSYRNQNGFTLVELMIGLVISIIVVSGTIIAYSSISSTVSTSKELDNAQEVLRYSSHVFSRSLKQTGALPIIDGVDKITINQDSGVVACNGDTPVADYSEEYTFIRPNLFCDIGNGPEVLITGVDNITYALATNSVLITVTPIGLPENFPDGIDINVALIRIIFEQATAE
ncbi:MAG: PilW family protein [Thalassotalea sp.]